MGIFGFALCNLACLAAFKYPLILSLVGLKKLGFPISRENNLGNILTLYLREFSTLIFLKQYPKEPNKPQQQHLRG